MQVQIWWFCITSLLWYISAKTHTAGGELGLFWICQNNLCANKLLSAYSLVSLPSTLIVTLLFMSERLFSLTFDSLSWSLVLASSTWSCSCLNHSQASTPTCLAHRRSLETPGVINRPVGKQTILPLPYGHWVDPFMLQCSHNGCYHWSPCMILDNLTSCWLLELV